MSADVLLSDLKDGVLTLTLNRPAKRNAMDSVTIEDLHSELDRAELDAGVRIVCLRGAGKDFCAGADLSELLASADRSAEENARSALRLGEVFLKLRGLPRPVVAVVQGRALAGGCGLATACDIVLAHAEAEFGYPEIRRGFVPAMVMAMLVRCTGEKVAFDLVATGRVMRAAEAREAGIVSRVLPADGFEGAVQDVLIGLASASATALALTKRQLYELDERTFAEGIRLGAQVNALSRSTPDFRAAVEQFLRKV